MISPNQQTVKSKSGSRLKLLRNFVFSVAGIVAMVTLIIFIIDKQSASEKNELARAVKIICPEHPLFRVEVETPGEEKWSSIVRIPRECGIKMSGDTSAVTIQTLPDEKQYGPGKYVKHLNNPEAVRFRTAKKDTVTVTFYPYEVFIQKFGE